MLRAVHHLSASRVAELPHYAGSLPDEVDLRVFRSPSERVTLLELWPDADRFAAFSADAEWEFWRLFRAPSELYPWRRFTRTKGVWHAVEDAGRATVQWGNGSGVRVLYQFPGMPSDTDPQQSQTLETHREPGCLEFEYSSDVDDPRRILLAELWRDQATYDAHWHLRLATGTPADTPATPDSGDVIEFYRHAEFTCLYGIWMPAEGGNDSRSQSVRWPS